MSTLWREPSGEPWRQAPVDQPSDRSDVDPGWDVFLSSGCDWACVGGFTARTR